MPAVARLIVYHPWLYLRGGAERFILKLVEYSRHDWTIVTNRYERATTFPEFTTLQVLELSRVPLARNPLAALLAGLRILGARMPEGFEGMLVSCEGLGDLVVVRNKSIPTVVYCHTPLKLACDPITQAAHMATRSLLYRAGMRLGLAGFLSLDRLLWRAYSYVFANSEEVRQRIVACGLRFAHEVEVLHPGVEPGRSPNAPRGRSVVVLGRIKWTKNLELAIRAFYASGLEDHKLVFVGHLDERSHKYYVCLTSLVSELGLRARVEFELNRSDAEVSELLGRASCGLFTSYNEDWGLAVLEMLASGLPVVSVDAGGPREILGQWGADFLGPSSPERLGALLRAACTSVDDAMRERARQTAASYSWEAMVNRIDSVFEEVIGPAERPGDHA